MTSISSQSSWATQPGYSLRRERVAHAGATASKRPCTQKPSHPYCLFAALCGPRGYFHGVVSHHIPCRLVLLSRAQRSLAERVPVPAVLICDQGSSQVPPATTLLSVLPSPLPPLPLSALWPCPGACLDGSGEYSLERAPNHPEWSRGRLSPKNVRPRLPAWLLILLLFPCPVRAAQPRVVVFSPPLSLTSPSLLTPCFSSFALSALCVASSVLPHPPACSRRAS